MVIFMGQSAFNSKGFMGLEKSKGHTMIQTHWSKIRRVSMLIKKCKKW